MTEKLSHIKKLINHHNLAKTVSLLDAEMITKIASFADFLFRVDQN